MKLTRNHPISATSRRAAIITAIALGLATCASAMSLRLEVPAQAIAPIHTVAPVHAIGRFGAQPQDGPTRISGGVMAGQIVSKVTPVYPQEAKEQGIQGTVVLHAIIDRDGTVKELAVISGPKELVPSAMEAVRQWIYKPFLLNGEPQEVDTTITVNFSLGNKTAPPPQAENNNAEAYQVGGSVRPPVLVHDVNPEYPESAKKAKQSGNVLVALVVDSNGLPQNVRIAKGLGNDLDEKAVEAVQQYRFKPATRDGEPVPVNLKVEVNFQIF